MKTSGYQNFISKPEISFWVPIVTSAVMLALSYGVLLTRIALLEQKMDTLISQNQQFIQQVKDRELAEDARYKEVLSRVGTNSTRITALETLESVRHRNDQ